MSLGNAVLLLGGFAVEGVVFYVVMRSVRRLTKPPPPPPRRPALRGELIPRRPELPAPPRTELTR